MIESDIWRYLIRVLRCEFDRRGMSDIAIKQSYQPVSQGRDEGDVVYLFKVTSKRVGHQARKYDYNAVNDNLDETGKYWLSATFQLTAQVEKDIDDSRDKTSYDIADICAAILQTITVRKSLLSHGLSIENIGDVRNPFSLSDRDQFDQDANFDFVLLYEQTISATVKVADPIEADIKRV